MTRTVSLDTPPPRGIRALLRRPEVATLAWGTLLGAALWIPLTIGAQWVMRQAAGPAPAIRQTAADPCAGIVEEVQAYQLRTGIKPVHVREAWVFCAPMPEPGR